MDAVRDLDLARRVERALVGFRRHILAEAVRYPNGVLGYKWFEAWHDGMRGKVLCGLPGGLDLSSIRLVDNPALVTCRTCRSALASWGIRT